MFLSKQSGYAFTNVRAGQAVHLSPPLKRRAVTTKQRCRVLYLSGRVVSTMSAGYTSEGKIGERCLRDRRNRPSAPRPAEADTVTDLAPVPVSNRQMPAVPRS